MDDKPWFEVWAEKRRGATPYLRVWIHEDGLHTIYDPARRAVVLETEDPEAARQAMESAGFSLVSGRTDFSAVSPIAAE